MAAPSFGRPGRPVGRYTGAHVFGRDDDEWVETNVFDRVCRVVGRLPGTGFTEGTWPTPEIYEIVVLKEGAGVAHAMRAELGDTGTYVGLALVCAEGGGEKRRRLWSFSGDSPLIVARFSWRFGVRMAA